MSTKRRTKVKGHPGIYRSSSGSYEICFRDEAGRLRFVTIAGGLEAAKAARADVVSRKAKGERVGPSRLTLDEYAQHT